MDARPRPPCRTDAQAAGAVAAVGATPAASSGRTVGPVAPCAAPPPGGRRRAGLRIAPAVSTGPISRASACPSSASVLSVGRRELRPRVLHTLPSERVEVDPGLLVLHACLLGLR